MYVPLSLVSARLLIRSTVLVQNAQECFHQIFAQLPESKCKIISRLEREDKELPSRSLVYGEIIYETIERIFEKVRSLPVAP